MPNNRIDRRLLATITNNPQAIAALENAFSQIDLGLPSTIEEAAAQATAAMALATQTLAMLAELAAAIEQLSMPARADVSEPDNFAPAFSGGTIATQNADAVELTGGTIEGTTVGAVTPAAGAFTSLSATGKFGCNSKAPQAAVTLGAAAIDAASTQTLTNNIRAALIANGIGA